MLFASLVHSLAGPIFDIFRAKLLGGLHCWTGLVRTGQASQGELTFARLALQMQVGLQIWRVEKFQIKDWPKEEYRHFYDADAYIVMNTYKKEGSNALKW